MPVVFIDYFNDARPSFNGNTRGQLLPDIRQGAVCASVPERLLCSFGCCCVLSLSQKRYDDGEAENTSAAAVQELSCQEEALENGSLCRDPHSATAVCADTGLQRLLCGRTRSSREQHLLRD